MCGKKTLLEGENLPTFTPKPSNPVQNLPPKLSSFVSKSTHTLILWLTFLFCVDLFFCGGFEEKIEKLKEWMKIAGRSPWEKANDDVPWFAGLWLEGKGGLPGS